MEILKGIEIIGKALWIKKHKILVVGDLHMGYEEALAKQGVYAPRRALEELKRELLELLELERPKKIILNGDIKHEFGEISKQEWSDVTEILGVMKDYCDEVIIVKGNHDKLIEPIAERMGVRAVDHYFLRGFEKKGKHDFAMDSICFVHGDKIIKNKEMNEAGIIIMGHEHPAVSLSEGEKSEKYKCFLLGEYNKKRLIVLPSFFSLIEGTDVNKEKLLSPYLHQDIGNFDVYVIGDDNNVYKFGSLKLLD